MLKKRHKVEHFTEITTLCVEQEYFRKGDGNLKFLSTEQIADMIKCSRRKS